MSKYEPVIGLEVHVQVKTESKMFCRCSARYFNEAPNSHVCPVCLGLPGALPVPNKLAIDKCIKLALALGCGINHESKFDRKNYFYPDLPKGYQISQYDQPIGHDGFLEFDLKDDSVRIRIRRVHMEEDTGKSLHNESETLLDFNKSGVPLAEIVTEPDFQNVAEVLAYAKRLRQIVRYLDISNADMEKGQMRFELNISIRPEGTTKLPDYKVEVKNISSISVLEKVINSEISRQGKILDEGKTPIQETRGLKDMSGETLSQRVKEEAEDYRYFPEPDIPPLLFDEKYIAEIKKEIGELPQEKKLRYQQDFGLDPLTTETIITSSHKAVWFEAAVKGLSDKKLIAEVARWFIGDLYSHIKSNRIKLSEIKVKPEQLKSLVEMLYTKKLSGTLAKQVLAEMFASGSDPESIAKEQGLEVVRNEADLLNIISQVVANNAKVVGDVTKNPNAIKFLVGQVMRETKGRADPVLTEKLLRGKLSA